MDADIASLKESETGELLTDTVIDHFKRFNIPNKLKDVGFCKADIPKPVEGTLSQRTVRNLSHRSAGDKELAALFKNTTQY